MAEQYQPQLYVHGSKLLRKAESHPALLPAVAAYSRWKAASLSVTSREKKDVETLTRLLNVYKNEVEDLFDSRMNSAQEVLQPSILEEFFEYLFCTLEKEIGLDMLRRPASGFIDLAFNPKSASSLLSAPEFTIRRKDHDFVIGAPVEVRIRTIGSSDALGEEIIVPAIAIECKRYLERNMLDECSGTAEKIKKATPYCLYFIAAEFLKMDDASPELSRIDEIYILRKQRNSERSSANFVPNAIDGDLVWDLYQQCIRHLAKIWWDPESALKTGKVFNLPR